jgi:hypothetical protein
MSIVVDPVLLGSVGGTEWPNTLGCDSCFMDVAGTCEGRDTGVALGSEVNRVGRGEILDARAFCIRGCGGEPVDAERR